MGSNGERENKRLTHINVGKRTTITKTMLEPETKYMALIPKLEFDMHGREIARWYGIIRTSFTCSDMHWRKRARSLTVHSRGGGVTVGRIPHVIRAHLRFGWRNTEKLERATIGVFGIVYVSIICSQKGQFIGSGEFTIFCNFAL